MIGAILFLAACVSVVVGGRAVIGKQLNAAMKRCDCVCRPMGGIYPWVLQDLRAELRKGELLQAHTWMAGPMVCLRSDETDINGRFDALQRAVDRGEEQRLLKGTP